MSSDNTENPHPLAAPVRDARGRFGPGNPGGPGRPSMAPEVKEFLEHATMKAARRVVEALDATKVALWQGQEVGEYIDHDTRLRAAEAIYSRLYGKPPVAVAVDPNNGGAPVGLVFVPFAAPPGGEER